MSQYEELIEKFMRNQGLCKDCRITSLKRKIWDSYCEDCHDKYLLLRTRFIEKFANYVVSYTTKILVEGEKLDG